MVKKPGSLSWFTLSGFCWWYPHGDLTCKLVVRSGDVLLFGRSVVSDSLWSHGLQYARLSCLLYHPEFAQIRVHWVSNAIQPSSSVTPSPFALNLSIRVFSSESALPIRWPKLYWSFSFSISLSNKYSGLISFRIDWFYLLAVQGTLKNLLQQTPQFKSINSSALSLLYGPTLSNICTWLLEKP